MKDSTKQLLKNQGCTIDKGGLFWWLLDNRPNFYKVIDNAKLQYLKKHNTIPLMSKFYNIMTVKQMEQYI